MNKPEIPADIQTFVQQALQFGQEHIDQFEVYEPNGNYIQVTGPVAGDLVLRFESITGSKGTATTVIMFAEDGEPLYRVTHEPDGRISDGYFETRIPSSDALNALGQYADAFRTTTSPQIDK